MEGYLTHSTYNAKILPIIRKNVKFCLCKEYKEVSMKLQLLKNYLNLAPESSPEINYSCVQAVKQFTIQRWNWGRLKSYEFSGHE